MFFYRVFCTIWVNFFIIKGFSQTDSVTLKKVVFIGLKKTNPAYLLRELPVKFGSNVALNERKHLLELNRQTLYNLRLFTRVSASDTVISDSLVQVFDMQERWYYTPRAHIELQERTLNDLLAQPSLYRTTLTTGLYWQNALGSNETVAILAKLGYTTGGLLKFTKPYLWPQKPWDLNAEIDFFQQHEVLFADNQSKPARLRIDNYPIFNILTANVSLSRRFNPRKSFTYSFGLNSFFTADTLNVIKPEFTAPKKRPTYPTFSIKYWHDTRDQRSFPLAGFKVQGSIQINYWNQIVEFSKIEMQLSGYYPITKRWNIAAGAYSFATIGSKIPYFERFFWGQKEYFIRGYEAYFIEGQILTALKSELKYGIIHRKMIHIKPLPQKFRDWPLAFYLSSFLDVGYAHHQSLHSRLHNKYLPGFGVGANFLFLYDTFFRVEISRNRFSETTIVLNFLLAIR